MSIRRLCSAALLVGTLTVPAFAPAAPGAPGSAVAADPSARLASLAQRYYDAQAQMDPVFSATFAGDNRFDDQLPIGIAPQERRHRFDAYRAFLRELAAIPRERLVPEDALTHELLDRLLRERLADEPFPEHLLPLEHMGSMPVVLATLGSGQAEQPLQTPAQYRAYLRRIERLPAWVDQAITNMREGVRRRVVQPRPIIESTLKQLRPLAADPLGDNPFYAPARRLPHGWPETERARLAADYRAAVSRHIVPAMRRLVDFVEREYLPAGRATDGWSGLPDGAAWYRQCVRSQTTTAMSPQQIHQVGLDEVARIQRELAALAPKLGHDGPPEALLAWVATNPRFMPFREEAQILDAYREIDRKVNAQLPRLFGRMPKAALEIRPEPELTKATASDHYSAPAEDGSRPGVFWAVIDDPAKYEDTSMTALFLHEGRPGHHFHVALQQELRLPEFRRRTWINAYGEGWALYAETLGHEMGLYDDPAAAVGQLRMAIARAARLVVDTGLHDQGWSRAQAIAYWMRTVGATEKQAANQIERYMVWPGQALGYMIGSLKIQALRAQAQRELGPRFDLAAFHDAVLAEGAMPLAILERRIEHWIAERKTRAGAGEPR